MSYLCVNVPHLCKAASQNKIESPVTPTCAERQAVTEDGGQQKGTLYPSLTAWLLRELDSKRKGAAGHSREWGMGLKGARGAATQLEAEDSGEWALRVWGWVYSWAFLEPQHHQQELDEAEQQERLVHQILHLELPEQVIGLRICWSAL